MSDNTSGTGSNTNIVGDSTTGTHVLGRIRHPSSQGSVEESHKRTKEAIQRLMNNANTDTTMPTETNVIQEEVTPSGEESKEAEGTEDGRDTEEGKETEENEAEMVD